MPQFISPSHVWWVWPCYEFTGNATFSQMHVISFNSEVHKRAQGRKRIGKKNFKKRWLRVTNQELSYHKQKGEWSQLWVHDKVTPPVQFWNVGVKPQTLVFAGSVSHGKSWDHENTWTESHKFSSSHSCLCSFWSTRSGCETICFPYLTYAIAFIPWVWTCVL